MNAYEAHALAIRLIPDERLLAFVKEKIARHANRGETELNFPFFGYDKTPGEKQQEAILRQLRKEGYTVTHHPDPDPGHPASWPYHSISWRTPVPLSD